MATSFLCLVHGSTACVWSLKEEKGIFSTGCLF